MGSSWYNVGIALSASLGTYLYVGLRYGNYHDESAHNLSPNSTVEVLTSDTAIAHQSWIDYMKHPSTAITGAVVAVYIAGEAVGSLLQILIADKLGRTRFMQFACVLVTIGVIIQTASINIGMLLAGRVIAGIAVGWQIYAFCQARKRDELWLMCISYRALSATVPIYLSEIGTPKTRGLIGGLSGVGLAAGTLTANWVGFAGSFAPYGSVQWRLPLGLQAPWGMILFICLSTYMPRSPRELIQKGDIQGARKEFTKIRSDMPAHEAYEEFTLMKAQIEYEKQRALSGYGEVFKVYRHRVLVCIAVQVLTSVTGVNVIQYYQTNLYTSLGIDAKTRLALAAIWGTTAFIANVIGVLILPDRWGRRKMLLAGVTCVIITEIYSAVLQREFQHTDNRVGKGFAILGIYIFAVCYYALINSTTWLYGSEIIPYFIRSKMVGVSAVAHYAVNVGFTEAGPTAFANIGENYYYVFVGVGAVYLVLIYLYFPETKQKSLEEIAAAFGDRVVELDEHDITVEGEIFGAKVTVSHVEEH
ncbi:putative MFS monosaccharide transporter [Xylariaceae sp. FL1272]|nr:putative MFS monosaccharide transporter [Xylariaceae sp. FL1272]